MILINEYRIITCSFYKRNLIVEWEIEKNEIYDKYIEINKKFFISFY